MAEEAADSERVMDLFRVAVRSAARLARELQSHPQGAAAAEARALVADLVELKADAEPLLAGAGARPRIAATEETILAEALDAIIAITGARRGFVVTLEGGEPSVRVARNLDSAPLGELERRLSRTILDDALRHGEAVLVPNALEHPRYGVSAGVSGMRILSVLAAPFRLAGRIAGAVYVDHDRAEGMFSPAMLERIARFQESIAATLESRRAVERLGRENRALREQVEGRTGFEGIVAASPAMTRVLEQAARFAQSPWPVMIAGEAGSGKELMARALHQAGKRRDGEFLALNMSAIPEALIEDTLFGHEIGAFADARKLRRGFFEAAAGGTLFLDEIGDAPAALQVKLLRAVQFGEIQRLGSDRPVQVDVRLIAATHRDLDLAVQEGRFRSDLLLRLNPLTLRIPPLRERPEDFPLLVHHFIRRYEGEVGKRGVRIESAALLRLQAADYAGTNVRRLENFVKYMLVVAEGDRLGEEHLPPDVGGATAGSAVRAAAAPGTFAELEAAKLAWRDELDRAFLLRTVAAAGGNVVKAAADAGADRSWYYTRAKQLGIELKDLRRRTDAE